MDTECEVASCSCKASYTSPTIKKAIRCKKHKEDAMMNLSVMCTEPDCFKYASCGYPNLPVIRCRAHALTGMTDRKKRCVDCVDSGQHPKIASFGFDLPMWCKKHAVPGSTNVVSARCTMPDCTKFAVDRGYCRKHFKSRLRDDCRPAVTSAMVIERS